MVAYSDWEETFRHNLVFRFPHDKLGFITPSDRSVTILPAALVPEQFVHLTFSIHILYSNNVSFGIYIYIYLGLKK